MKRWLFLLGLLMAAASQQMLIAQIDSATTYINGLPVTEDDTVTSIPQHNFFPSEGMEKVLEHALPEKLLNELNGEPRFKGWKNYSVYVDKNTGLFYVRIRQRNDIIIYGLNDSGKTITYDQYTMREDQ